MAAALENEPLLKLVNQGLNGSDKDVEIYKDLIFKLSS